jgi:hypothetical protein
MPVPRGPEFTLGERIVILLVKMAMTALAGFIVWYVVATHVSARKVVDGLIQTSADLNRDLPKMIDDKIRLDSIDVGAGKSLRYHYTVLDDQSLDGTELSIRLKPELLQNYRTDPQFAAFRADGVTLVYAYFDRVGNEVTEIQVGPYDLWPSLFGQ